MNFTFLLFALYVLTSDKKDEKTRGLLKTDLNPLTGEVLEREKEEIQVKRKDSSTDGAQNNESNSLQDADLDGFIAKMKKVSDKELLTIIETLLNEVSIDEECLCSNIIRMPVYDLNSNETIDGSEVGVPLRESDMTSKDNDMVCSSKNKIIGNTRRLNAPSVVVVRLSTQPKKNNIDENKTTVQDIVEKLKSSDVLFNHHATDFNKLLSEVGMIVDKEKPVNSVKEDEHLD